MRRKGDFESIEVILKRIIKKSNLTSKFLEEKLKKKWKKIVGEEISKHIIPLQIKNKILYIKIENPIWNNEFNFLKKEIIEKVNLNMDKNIIKDIRSKIY
ncbi:MAG: DUF721 domain-containing protein [bacterium]|nr:DUF721 domain-containing protein [bacterium]